MSKSRIRFCGCGKNKTLQPLEKCRVCIDCNQEMHTQYDILLHYDHKQRELVSGRLLD